MRIMNVKPQRARSLTKEIPSCTFVSFVVQDFASTPSPETNAVLTLEASYNTLIRRRSNFLRGSSITTAMRRGSIPEMTVRYRSSRPSFSFGLDFLFLPAPLFEQDGAGAGDGCLRHDNRPEWSVRLHVRANGEPVG